MTPTKKSQGIFSKVGNLLFPSPNAPTLSANNNRDQRSHEAARIPWPPKEVAEIQLKFQRILDNMEFEWDKTKSSLQSTINDLQRDSSDLNARIYALQARLHESELQKRRIQEDHDTFVRKQQESSFKQMESTRWLSMDQGKLVDDLVRLKRGMRTWAKGTSVKDYSVLHLLDGAATAALKHNLSHVVLLENNQLPPVLFVATKSPVMLLYALLTHSVYSAFFQSPFFFLHAKDGDTTAHGDVLETMYQWAQMCKLHPPR